MGDASSASHTRYGFNWGNLSVERIASEVNGRRYLLLKTPREMVEVYVTPSGLIRLQRKPVLREQEQGDG